MNECKLHQVYIRKSYIYIIINIIISLDVSSSANQNFIIIIFYILSLYAINYFSFIIISYF